MAGVPGRLAALAGVAVTLSVAPPASAATIPVPCDSVALVAAINTANASPEADTLELASGCLYPLTVADNTPANPNGLPVISTEIAIDGNGATIFRQSVGEFRILFVAASGSLSLSDVTVSNGRESGFALGGAGILNDGGTVRLTRATVLSNYTPSGQGGGIRNGPGGTLTVTDSAILHNEADDGAGISNAAGATLTVTGGFFRGGRAIIRGGAVENDGNATIVNSTIWDNEAVVLEGGGISNSGTLTLTHATVASNSAGVAGGNLHNSGTLVVTNSVLSSGENGNCGGAAAVADGGGNVRFPASDASCPAGFAFGDPLLGSPAENGGATPTMKPGVGSAALDAADAADCAVADQRGVLRPAGSGCDAGAFELARPGAAIGVVVDVVADAASLTGIVVNGHPGAEARFEYGPSAAQASTVGVGIVAAVGGQFVSARATGLTPSTTYFYRLVVTNGDGVAQSGDGTFTTPAAPAPPGPPPPPPPPVCAGRAATIVGSTGTGGADVIVGTRGADTIDGGGGDDVICAGGGADRVNGGAGEDRLLGGAGGDRLAGGAGADRLLGGAGADRLAGGLGDDVVDGGSGADLLDERGQGRGRDTLLGGAGADRVFTAGGEPDRVRCGAGRDRVAADRRDRLRACERVRRP